MGLMTSGAGLSPGEYLVFRMHPHWKTVLRPFLVLALIVAVALTLLVVLPAGADRAPVRIAIGALSVLAAIAWCLVPLLRWRATSYELTSRRLRLRSGVLTRTGRDFPLARISDVSFTQGPLDRLLRCGRLIVESAGEHGQLVLANLPHARAAQSELFRLVGEEQARLDRVAPAPPAPGSPGENEPVRRRNRKRRRRG
jgi:membrane protein YdbS with pleckstrin-like domain